MSTAAENSLNHDPLVGETLGGRYKIDRLIGRGGIGLVYLALDQVEGRKVVVKVLAPHWTDDDDAVARFDREALRMAKLDHPNVVRMYDHGHHGDQAFIVMEFLDGEPLRNYLNRKKTLSFEEFVPIASQVLAGVGYVHARNIMLRDIKPPNIMLCERDGKANHVKLLDFGLAKLMGEDDELTKAHVIGTAGYLSPEQIRGEKIDVRVDVYALGIMFFLMLTGESPIDGDNDAAVLFNHVHGDRKRLEDLLPEGHRVPPEVIELLHQCLSKIADERPADANEMAEVLFESVHPSMFLLPTASDVTRRPAQEYWAKRLKKGASFDEDLEASSGEHTRPVVKRTLEEARNAAALHSGPQSLAPRKSGPRKAAPAKPPLPSTAKAPPKRTTPKKPPLRTGERNAELSQTQFGMPKAAEKAKPPPLPKPSSTTLGLPVPKRLRSSTPPPGASAAITGSRPTAHVLDDPAAESSSSLPKPKPSSAPTPPPRRIGIEAPAAAVAARVDQGLTVQFDADDARAAALREHAPTGQVSSRQAAAMAGIPAIVEGPDNDSLPIAIDDEPLPLGTPNDITAVGTGPITSVGNAPDLDRGSNKLLWVLVAAGLGALALGGVTAYFALAGPDEPTPAVAKGDDAPTDADEKAKPTPPPEPEVVDGGGANEPEPVAADDGDDEVIEISGEPEAAPLKVKGPTGATLLSDGVEIGKLPFEGQVPHGKHTLRVEAEGYDAWETEVTVEPDKGAQVEAKPKKAAVGSTKPKPGSKKPKPGKTTPAVTPATDDPTPKPEPKPKPDKKDDVFMNPAKGDDGGGIFLPVGK